LGMLEIETMIIPPEVEVAEPAPEINWVINASLLWRYRRRLVRAALFALAAGLAIAFTMPKRYESSARIMPPDQAGSGGGAVLAAILGRSAGSSSGLGSLGSLAGSLLGSHNTSALFVDLLHSGTVASHLIDRFDLQRVYHKRYRVDTAKYLMRHTTVVDDKKSGVITIEVTDTDPRRARDLAQGYLDELNQIVMQTSTSSGHQERVFLERRLASVRADLERAQLALSEFSSTHTTIDITEQTRAMVDAASKLDGQLIVGQSEVDSLKQIYGDGNVRVRAAQARVIDLQHELNKMSGTSAQLPAGDEKSSEGSAAGRTTSELYPPLRQLPRLAVPYGDLYRTVRVNEAVFELLTQEYEMARIQEAKDVPVVSVIDAPGIPEKKSFPPRLLVALLFTAFCLAVHSAWIILQYRWSQVSDIDPRKILMDEIGGMVQTRLRSYLHFPQHGDAH
jgi:uncharacterized protein involved in exopolysaccharide biosynthesis